MEKKNNNIIKIIITSFLFVVLSELSLSDILIVINIPMPIIARIKMIVIIIFIILCYQWYSYRIIKYFQKIFALISLYVIIFKNRFVYYFHIEKEN